MTGFFGFSPWIQPEPAQRQMLPAGLLVPSRTQKFTESVKFSFFLFC